MPLVVLFARRVAETEMDPDDRDDQEALGERRDPDSPRASSFRTVGQSDVGSAVPPTCAPSEPARSSRMGESVVSRLRRTKGSVSGDADGDSGAECLSRYDDAREIARGGMGAILEVFDRDIRRPVAMKMALWASEADKLDRFIEEAQVTGQLEHPNIVPVHEIGTDDRGRVYFTMKLVRGESLQKIIDRISERDPESMDKYGPAALLQVFLKVCDAVAFAHSRGIIHRDLKPENVMVGRFGEVQVMDWGLAKVRGRSDAARGELVATVRTDASALKTLDGEVMGTPSFMPPEQAAGEIDEIDERSDVWALGAMLYALLCHDAPYSGDTVDQVLLKAVTAEVKPPVKRAPWLRIPPELDAICMKCLCARKADRYQCVEDLSSDLRAFLDRRLVQAYRYGVFERVTRWVQRHPTASVGGSVGSVLIALGAGLALFLMQQARISDLRALEAEQRTEVAQEKAASAEQVAVKAEAKAESAMTLLEKGRRVAVVLRAARIDLAHVFRSLEAACFSGKPASSRSAILQGHADALKSFEERLHDDSATRAAWLALEGWLNHLAGDEDSASALFDQATAKDPDVAYGRLFRAMVAAASFLEIQPMPKFEVVGGQVVIVDVPDETPEIVAARERFASELEAVRSSGVFGEASAEEFGDLVAGLKAFHGGPPGPAEAALTRALAIPETAWLEVDLMLARAKVRHILGSFEAEEQDLDSILGRFPSHPRARFSRARIRLEEARVLMDKRLDSRPKYIAALEIFSSLVEEDPGNRPARASRAMINLLLGRIHNHRRMPWEENFSSCFADFDALLAADPANVEHLSNRGWAHKEHGGILRMHGKDCTNAYMLAVADFDAVTAIQPQNGNAICSRSETFLQLAEAALSRNADPSEWFERAAADCMLAEGIPSFRGRALGVRADLLLSEAAWRNSRGEDAVPLFEKAIEALTELLKRTRRHPMTLARRGGAYAALGEALARRGLDALTALDAACEDLRETVQRDPLNTQAHDFLGRSLIFKAEVLAGKGRHADGIEVAREGIGHMDVAVQKSPGYPHLRFDRALTLLRTSELVLRSDGDPSEFVEKMLADCAILEERAPQYRQVKAMKARALLIGAAHGARSYGRLPEDNPTRGERESRVLEMLGKAVENGLDPSKLPEMPEFQPLRGRPGFEALVRQAKGE